MGRRGRQRIWTEEVVINTLKSLKKNGEPVNTQYLINNHRSLRSAMVKRFGSWEKAVVAAGLDPKKERAKNQPTKSNNARKEAVVKTTPQSKRKSSRKWRGTYKQWSKDKIIAQLHEIKLNGEAISYNSLRQNGYSGLAAAACRYFGSWEKAIIASGFDPDQESLVKRSGKPSESWDKDKVISRFKEIKAKGGSINYKAIQENHYGLWSAACYYFGSWEKAVTVAGFNPDEEKLFQKFALKRKIGRHPLAPSEEYERSLVKQGKLNVLFPAMRQLREQLGRAATDVEIAHFLKKSVEEIANWQSSRERLILSYLPLAESYARHFYEHQVKVRHLTSDNKYNREEFRAFGSLWLVEVMEEFDWGDEFGGFSGYFKVAFERRIYYRYLIKEIENPIISFDYEIESGRDGSRMILADIIADPRSLPEPEYDPKQLSFIKSALNQLPGSLKHALMWDLGMEFHDKTPAEFATFLGVAIGDIDELIKTAIRKFSSIVFQPGLPDGDQALAS